jgi:hypothetical protein
MKAGKLMTAAEIIQTTAEANRAAVASATTDWAPFRTALAAELGGMAKRGELSNMQQHITAWRQIATALQGYGK